VNDEGYSDDFGYEWNRWARMQFEDRNLRGLQGHTTHIFDPLLALPPTPSTVRPCWTWIVA